MKKFLQILKKIMSGFDYFYIITITLSLIVAIFVDDGSWRIILISVSVLFIVAFISSVAQKFTEYYENVPRSAFKSTSDYQVTTKNSDIGTRQTIENFDQTDDYSDLTNKTDTNPSNIDKQENDEEKKATPTIQHFAGYSIDEEYSHVRVIKKTKIANEYSDNDTTEQSNVANSISSTPMKTVSVHTDEDLFSNTEQINNIDNLENNNTHNTHIQAQNDQAPLDNITHTNNANQNNVIQNDNLEQSTNQNNTNNTNEENNANNNFEKVLLDFPTNFFFENHPIFNNEPKLELEYFISRILMIIKSTVTSNTVGLFLLKPFDQHIKLYSYVTENENFIIKDTAFNVANDIISEIIKTSKPEILTEINYSAVPDILPYYKEVIEIKSFVGVPIFQKHNIVGVLTLDSFENDSFDSSIISYLGNFTKIISSILTSLNEKYELMISAKTLKAIKYFRTLLSKDNIDFNVILESAFSAISDILNFDNIGFCNFSSQTNSWQIQALKGSEQFVKSIGNKSIDTSKALIARTLFNSETLILAPIKDNLHIVSPTELFNPKGYFIAVPLQSINSNYGSIFIYGENYLNITSYDVEILQTLSEHIASTIEKFFHINVFKNYAQIDPKYGILNPTAFYQAVEDEVIRSKDFNYQFAFLTFLIDNYQSYHQTAGLNQSLQLLEIDTIKNHIRQYDKIGFVDENVVGVALINTNRNEIKILAEKIRNEIANKYITVNNHRFMITLSIGIALSTPDDDIDSIVNKSIQMLQEAAKKTNSICIF
jgi:diguanylate cyclase (GGDEF)-like protein